MKFRIPALALLASAVHADIVTLAHPGDALPEKSTVVWSPLYQATWDRLHTPHGGPREKVAKLDLSKWDAGIVTPEDSWKTWTGPATNDFLKQANEEAVAITGEKADPFRLAAADHVDRVAFGLLDCDMEFQEMFVRSRKAPLDFRAGGLSRPVHFFGIRWVMSKPLSDTARVLAYRPADHSCALQLRGRKAGETIILYLPAKPQAFSTACTWLRTWLSQSHHPERARAWDDPSLHLGDEIRIPSIDLATREGVIHHPKVEPRAVIKIKQITRFQLHEKNAHLPNETLTEMEDPFAEPQPPSHPRKFIYDRPFFVFLWRDGAEWPYFGAWIGDASALKAF